MPRDDPDWINEQRRELGERIADRRAARRLSQEAFCEIIGLSRSTLQRIELGQTDARYGDLLRIAAALDTRVSVLVD